MLRTAARRTFASALLFTALLGTAPAGAEGGSSAAAQALFDQGKALMSAGKAREACPKFEESQKLDPGSGTLINLALCYEKTGRTASAWSAYQDAATAARLSGNSEREHGARSRAAALAPKVSKLTVEVPADVRVTGLVVMRDDVEVGPAQWGTPIPTDEGDHELSAKAPGYEAWHTTVSVGARGASASVTVPKLVAEPKPETPPPVVPVEAPPPTPVEPAPAPKSGGLGGQRIGALVLGGVGVAGVAVGSVFGFKAMSNKKEADKTCDGTACTTDAGVTAGNDAHQAGTISTVAMIVGAAGLAGGAVLWFTAPKGSAQVGLAPNGVVLRRVF
jgi:serine/threonine-protein kinase